MSKKKTTPKPSKSAARADGATKTDRARKAAIDEIQARIDAPETSEVPPPTPDVGPTGKAAKTGGPRGPKARERAAPRPTGSNASAMKPKRLSGLDAAALILGESSNPMKCAEILAAIQARGLWRTTGKTPEATLYAAMIREISAKNGDARFRKVDRGLFTTNTKAH